jgi:uncharacterized protein YkwD
MFKNNFLLFFFAGIMAICVNFNASAQKRQSCEGMENEVLHYINEHREHIGLRPLVMNEAISEAAAKHSHDMATGRVPFGHEGFDARMAKLRRQIKPVYGWAENVAMGDETAKEVVETWLHSPGHRQNIEGDYNLTGIGIVRSKDGDLYFTQIFMRKSQ